MNAVERAVSIVGSQASLAKAVGVTPQAVHLWVHGGNVDARRVGAIEAATGGKVTRFDLRPDVFGQPPEEDNRAA